MIVVLVVLLVAMASPAWAARVRDEGRFFSAGAVQQAETALEELWSTKGKSVVVQTYDAPPPQLASKLGGDVARAFGEYAREQTKSEAADLYVLICRKPTQLRIAEREQAGMPPAVRDRIAGEMVASFRQRQYDAGLLAAVDQMRSGFTGAVAPANQPRTAPSNTPAAGIGAYLCVGLVVFGIIIAIISMLRRVFGRSNAAQQGYGGYGDPNQQQPGQHAGGGGFGRGLERFHPIDSVHPQWSK